MQSQQLTALGILITVSWNMTPYSLIFTRFSEKPYLLFGVSSCTLKIETADFSKMLVPSYQTTQGCVTEDPDHTTEMRT